MDILQLIGRNKELFTEDIKQYNDEISEIINSSSFLVIGAAGSIGQAVTKEIFKRKPSKLHAVDLSENNLTELVRDLRSSFGYIDGEFKTFALDIGSIEYDAFIENDGEYDYVLNLSALKHVRSERDPYTLMRMIKVNILNTEKTLKQSIKKGVKKYFCVSTDKAANPVNMMGASKKLMELFLFNHSSNITISTARFANVAFSDGSLLHSFNQRISKKQPISAPNDVRRYFVIPKEAGELCLLSCILGENRDIYFPKLSEELHLITFSSIAKKFLRSLGYEPIICKSEDEARELINTLPQKGKWPCYFSASDTTGEKDFEEFYTDSETLEMSKFKNIGIIKNEPVQVTDELKMFKEEINEMLKNKSWDKKQLIELFSDILPNFDHLETKKYLDSKM